ncbi:hypothetical protein AGMMS50229_11090 [Campylobacterota bacterium]|nr:hypothetical protein AGMMS50229_11090 [Campylobacterota bacterium]
MKLHLGCGKRYIPGFVHIDAVDYPHIDHVATIDTLSFIPDNSVELIYACHVLEHFKRRDLAKVLAEWRRVLLDNGGGGVQACFVSLFRILPRCARFIKKLASSSSSLAQSSVGRIICTTSTTISSILQRYRAI